MIVHRYEYKDESGAWVMMHRMAYERDSRRLIVSCLGRLRGILCERERMSL